MRNLKNGIANAKKKKREMEKRKLRKKELQIKKIGRAGKEK